MGTEAIIPSVAASNPQFTRKLAHLIKTRWHESQAALGEKVGVSRQAIADYKRGAVPSPPVLFRLARELGVEHALLWLFDEDDQSLDPPKHVDLSTAEVWELRRELARRYIEFAVPFYNAMERRDLEGIEAIAIWCLSNVEGAPPPPVAKRAIMLVYGMYHMTDGLWLFGDFTDADIASAVAAQREDGTGEGAVADRLPPARELTPEALYQRWERLKRDHPGIEAILRYIDESNADVRDTGWQPPKHDQAKAQGEQPFWEWEAPYRLARIITHPSFTSHPSAAKYEPLRKSLIEAGYLDREGRPIDLPGVDLPDAILPEPPMWQTPKDD